MQQIIDSMQGAVAEGVQTTKAAKRLADKLGVSTPIIQGLYRLLFGEPRLGMSGLVM
jgi:glycerol-3-phosphate dehydrogenase